MSVLSILLCCFSFSLIHASLCLPCFFWGVPSAPCLPFVTPLVKPCTFLRINVSHVVHQNHFGPEKWRADDVRLLLFD